MTYNVFSGTLNPTQSINQYGSLMYEAIKHGRLTLLTAFTD